MTTWLRRSDVFGQYSRGCCPSPGWYMLPAANSRFFARNGSGPGPSRRHWARCWAPFVGSFEAPDIASTLALRLPARYWENFVPFLDLVLSFPAGTDAFFFFRAIASLSCLRRAGEIYKFKIALINGNSFCFFMMLRQDHYERSSCHSSGEVML